MLHHNKVDLPAEQVEAALEASPMPTQAPHHQYLILQRPRSFQDRLAAQPAVLAAALSLESAD